MLRTALVTDRRYLRHFAGRSHPERPERAAVMIEMAEDLRRAGILTLSPREASIGELELCHDPAYVAEVKRSASMPRYDFDPDTHASPESYQTALLAAGGGGATIPPGVHPRIIGLRRALSRPPGWNAGDRGWVRRAGATRQALGGRMLRGPNGCGSGGRLRSPGAGGFGAKRAGGDGSR